MGGLLVVVAIVAGTLAYNDFFYLTGSTWYEACWEKRAKLGSIADKDPVADDPYTDAIWTSCEQIAQRAVYKKGIIFAGNRKSNDDIDGARLLEACPSLWTDVPIGGLYLLALKVLQESGGAGFVDHFTPAEWTIGKAFERRWPHCSAERQRQGYPTIVELSPGTFGWSAPCTKCEARGEPR